MKNINGWIIDGIFILPVEAFTKKIDWLKYILEIFPSEKLYNFCYDRYTDEEINLIVEVGKNVLNERTEYVYKLPEELFKLEELSEKL